MKTTFTAFYSLPVRLFILIGWRKRILVYKSVDLEIELRIVLSHGIRRGDVIMLRIGVSFYLSGKINNEQNIDAD